MPGISPTGGEITSGLNFVSICRFVVLDADCLGKPVSPANVGEMSGRAEGRPRHDLRESFASSSRVRR
ncbi:hypothetical protein ELI07_01405 [Rhizobium leguminosarum]|nr:hypothetical protein ELI40_01270 [Rhizobium leguminosarum]TAX12458.1 hypothetical protein ELI07_01405 [Rhizobium leguminosarum]TAY15034.1 hypothetical protein ELH96_01215 [Rhizobium leguminosarum]